MIKEGKCKICGANIRENGGDRFRESVERHYSLLHKERWKEFKSLEENAELDLKDVKEKYPEIFFYWGIVQVDMKELLN